MIPRTNSSLANRVSHKQGTGSHRHRQKHTSLAIHKLGPSSSPEQSIVKVDDTSLNLFLSQQSVPQSRHRLTQTQTNTHIQTHTYKHTDTDIQKHTYMHTDPQTHTQTSTQLQTDTHINIHRHTHTCRHTQVYYLFTVSEFNTKQYHYWLLKMLLLCRYVIMECVHGLRSNE